MRWIALLAALALGCVGPQITHAGMESARDKAELSRMWGTGPERCEPNGETEICTWRYPALGSGGWSSSSFVMVCILPTDGRPKAPGACKASPW